MKNYGQIKRKVKIKKRYTLSPNVLNLTDEAKKWSELEKRLRGEINEIIWDIVTESVSLGIDSRPGDLREKKMQVADQAKASILDWVEREVIGEKNYITKPSGNSWIDQQVQSQIDGENQLITRQLERLNKEREGNDE